MGSGMNYEHKATPLQAWCDALAFVEHTAKIKGNYRKLRRLARLVRRGKKSERRFDASYQAIRSCAELGDSKRLLRKMDSIYNNLKMEIAA